MSFPTRWFRSSDRRLLILYLCCCLLHVVAVAFFFDVVIDDAYISARYAENLVAGHGLTFNPGERVEGFSHPLFVLLIALGPWLGLSTIAVAKAIGLLASLLAIAVVFVAFRRWGTEAGGSELSLIHI